MKFVTLDTICADLGVRVLSYDVGAETIRAFHMEEIMRTKPWFCVMYGDLPIFFFDSTRPCWFINLSLARALGFFARGYVTAPCKDRISPGERLTADFFALRLLWRIMRVNPNFLPTVIRNDLDRMAARRRRRRAAHCARKRRWLHVSA